MKRIAVSIVLAATLALAACGGRPNGVLIPTAVTAPGTSQVDMMVATTRSSANAEPGQLFTGERGRGLSFADITVSLPPDSVRQIGEVQWPKEKPGNPATDFVTRRADILDRDEALKIFDNRVRRTPKRQVLVFVHGFNTRFEEAVYRFAQIVHDSGTTALPVLFTWPSRGRLLAYTYDYESASYSRDALETLLLTLIRDKSVGEISILAHSMGNWVTIEALRQLSIRERGIPKKITGVMLAAPDVGVDVFRRQIATIGDRKPPFTLFVSQDDDALAVSRRVWGQTRIGAVNPEQEPYRNIIEEADITVVDLTKVKSPDSLNHGKFAQAPEVVQSIGRRLAGGQALQDGRAGLGDKLGQVAIGAASTVGSAATIAVSAPVAIIDPATRENLGDRFEEMGNHAANTLSLPPRTETPAK